MSNPFEQIRVGIEDDPLMSSVKVWVVRRGQDDSHVQVLEQRTAEDDKYAVFSWVERNAGERWDTRASYEFPAEVWAAVKATLAPEVHADEVRVLREALEVERSRVDNLLGIYNNGE